MDPGARRSWQAREYALSVVFFFRPLGTVSSLLLSLLLPPSPLCFLFGLFLGLCFLLLQHLACAFDQLAVPLATALAIMMPDFPTVFETVVIGLVVLLHLPVLNLDAAPLLA